MNILLIYRISCQFNVFNIRFVTTNVDVNYMTRY